MRITFVVPVLDLSGGARIVAGHAQRLAARGHEVLIVAPKPPRPSPRQRLKWLISRDSPSVSAESSHYALAHVPIHVPKYSGPIRAADVPDADVIIATWWETAEWIWPMPSAKGAKVHFIQHYEAFQNIPVERVDAVWRLPIAKIVVAQWLADLGRERFGIEEIALVPNSVDHHFFKSKRRNKGEPPTVGFLFHNAAFKDLPTTLAAIRELRRVRPETRLLSFGEMKPSAGELPTDCEFHYRPAQEEIAKLYGRSDVWLSTSRSEGFNLPPLEAMATGCPAVCAKTGRPLEIISDGFNGRLVDQGDIAAFTHALASVLALSDAEWRRMSDAARAAVAHPTWNEASALFEDALIGITAG